MREIKFRGKDLKTKQWVYGYYSCGYREYSYQETEEYKHWIELWNGRSYFISEVDQNTVGQFTGLKDKNGVEIYEGDIIELMLHTGEKEKFICEYKTEKNGFRFISQEANDDCWYIIEGNNTIEVVGNIHD